MARVGCLFVDRSLIGLMVKNAKARQWPELSTEEGSRKILPSLRHRKGRYIRLGPGSRQTRVADGKGRILRTSYIVPTPNARAGILHYCVSMPPT